MRNVEIKCELRDRARAQQICRELGARRVGLLEQRDTYYRVPGGRLKRRESPGRADCWIAYERADDASARPSDYELLSSEQAARRFDLQALSQWAVVDKRRSSLADSESRYGGALEGIHSTTIPFRRNLAGRSSGSGMLLDRRRPYTKYRRLAWLFVVATPFASMIRPSPQPRSGGGCSILFNPSLGRSQS